VRGHKKTPPKRKTAMKAIHLLFILHSIGFFGAIEKP
jgi:hypothetical protein